MKNDIEGLKYTVDKFSDMIMRISYQRVRSKADSEDILQDVLISVVKYLPFESDESLKAWLIRATINKCKDFFKSAYRKRTVPLDEARFMLEDEDEKMYDELLKLKDKDRDLIYLYYFEGYAVKEIAKVLEKKEKTVFARLDRARSKLKFFLEEK